MSIKLLLNLNGNYRGAFHRWLDNLKKEPRIAWYPSAGQDFRDLLYLHPEFSKQYPGIKPDPPSPDIFLHTDYYPWRRSRFFDTRTVYKDDRTEVYIKSIEELPRCDLPLDEQIVNHPNGSKATGRVIFLELEISSSVLGRYSYPLIYAFCDNAAFCSEKIIKNNGRCSHIVHVRFGGGLGGGGKSTGVWLLNILQKLQCEMFITDSHYGFGSGDKRIYELYPEFSGNKDENQLKQIRKINSRSWSCYGDVSWNLTNFFFNSSSAHANIMSSDESDC